MARSGGESGGKYVPGKRPTPPVITTARATLRSLKELLYAHAATVSPPSEWPSAPTRPGSATWWQHTGRSAGKVDHCVEHEGEVRGLVDDVAAIPVALGAGVPGRQGPPRCSWPH